MKKLFLFSSLVFLFNCSDDKAAKETVGPEAPSPVDPDSHANQGILINEISAWNNSYLDEFGEDPGWIELYNPTSNDINTKGMLLKESKKDSGWALPATTLKPQERLLVFASGNNIYQTDSIQLKPFFGLNNQFNVWADEANDPPGLSFVEPLNGSNYFDGTGDSLELAIRYFMGDNSDNIGWASSSIEIYFVDSKASSITDLTGYDQVHFNASFAKNRTLKVSLIQNDRNSWEGENWLIEGNGADSLYQLKIPIGDANLELLRGIRIEPSYNSLDTTELILKNFYFTQSKHHHHTSFQLDKKGGNLYLYDSLGHIADHWEYQATSTHQSIGRIKDGNSQIVLFNHGTPDKSNNTGNFSSINPNPGTPEIQPGFYLNPLTIKFHKEPGAKIFASRNGTKLFDENNLLTSDTVSISKTTSLRWATISARGDTSLVSFGTWFINENHDLDVISIHTDDSLLFDPINGLYELGMNASDELPYYGANFWKETELPIQIEFFRNQSSEWKQNAGLKIFGNWSRANAKKSLSIHFREKYGQSKLKYELFNEKASQKTFKNFLLRNNGGNFTQDHYRDGINHTLASRLGLIHQRFRPSILYINGKYWGIHNLRDKVDFDHFAINEDTTTNGFDLIKPNEEVQSGSLSQWRTLLTSITAAKSNDSLSLHDISSTFDIDDYVKYIALQTFIVNTDWPANNFKTFKTYTPNSKWRYVLYDTDFSYGWPEDDYDFDMMAHVLAQDGPDWPNGPKSTLVFRELSRHDDFVRQFANTAAFLTATTFAPDSILAIKDSLEKWIATDRVRDMQRWGQSDKNFQKWSEKTEFFIKYRRQEYLANIAYHFNLGSIIDVGILPNGGTLLIENQTLSKDQSFKFFSDLAIKIEAVSTSLKTFKSWSDGSVENPRFWHPNSEGLIANWNN